MMKQINVLEYICYVLFVENKRTVSVTGYQYLSCNDNSANLSYQYHIAIPRELAWSAYLRKLAF